MKEYTFKVIIKEGGDEFWEKISTTDGCKEVAEWLRQSLVDGGFFLPEDCQVYLEKFTLDI